VPRWSGLFGDVVDARAAPGVAAGQPAHCEPSAAERAVAFERFERIGRTGRLEAAAMADPGAEHDAIETHGQRKEPGGGRQGRAFATWPSGRSPAALA